LIENDSNSIETVLHTSLFSQDKIVCNINHYGSLLYLVAKSTQVISHLTNYT